MTQILKPYVQVQVKAKKPTDEVKWVFSLNLCTML